MGTTVSAISGRAASEHLDRDDALAGWLDRRRQGPHAAGHKLSIRFKARFQFSRRRRDKGSQRRPGSLEALGQPFQHRQAIDELSTLASVRARSSASLDPIISSSAASSGVRRRTPTIAAACDCNSARPARRWNGVAERNEGEGRFCQAAQDRQPHPGIIGIFGGDLAQGLERGGLVAAAIAQRDRRVEPHADGGVLRQLDQGRRGEQLLVKVAAQRRRHSQGVLAQPRVRVACDVGQQSLHRRCPPPRASTSACSRARGLVLSLRTAIKKRRVSADRSRLAWMALIHRSTSSRWAVLRHQPLGWPNKSDELGRVGLAQVRDAERCTFAVALGRTRQIRPRSCQRRKSTTAARDSGTN